MAVISIKDFVKISFEATEDDSITLSESGVVCLYLQDTVTYEGVYTIKNRQDIPKGISPTNVKSIELALLGKPSKVIAVIAEGTADAVKITDANTALARLETTAFNFLAIPGISAEDATKVAKWADDVNMNPLTRFVVVLPNTTADSANVINFAHESVTIEGQAYTTTQATPYVAAFVAATVPNKSLTNARTLIEDCTPMSIKDIDAAGNAGKLVLFNDGKYVRFASDCNSKTTVGDSENETYQDIRCNEIMNLFYNSAKTSILEKCIGKYSNSYNNKLLIVGKIYELLKDFEKAGLAEQGDTDVAIDLDAQIAYLRSIGYKSKTGKTVSEMSKDEILRANTRKKVFIKVRMIPLSAIEAVEIVVRT